MSFMLPDHIQPPKEEKILLIFYDLEAKQDQLGYNGAKMCVLQQRCGFCIEDNNELRMSRECGDRGK